MNKTGIVWEPIYAEHLMSVYHPESPARIQGIKKLLSESDVGKNTVKINARPASKEELLWVHDPAYIKMIEKTAGKVVALDPDTTAGPMTWDAARMAAGGVIEAVKAVLEAKVDNAFAFVRPPGHHAEHDQARGFCFFNNIAIAAEYAIKKMGIKRIAIVDFDIHHGNGTQHAFYSRSDVFYMSTHRWPFFPGTGNRTEHGRDLGNGYTLNIPLERGDDEEFKDVYSRVIIPVIKEYKPELILVSAGYDAHTSDPIGGFSITTEAYNFVTKKIFDTAKECCGGKMVMVLEGGYNIATLRECIEGALNILEKE